MLRKVIQYFIASSSGGSGTVWYYLGWRRSEVGQEETREKQRGPRYKYDEWARDRCINMVFDI